MKRFTALIVVLVLSLSLFACTKQAKQEYDIEWSSIALPDGFPKLADGVTEFISFSGENKGFHVSWDIMSLKAAETVVDKLENWLETDIQKYETESDISWYGGNDPEGLSIEMRYVGEPVESHPQVVLSVNIFSGSGM